MPQHNPLVTEAFMPDASGSLKSVNPGTDLALGVGPIHLTVIGVVLLAVAGLIALRKLGFRFSVTVGGGR